MVHDPHLHSRVFPSWQRPLVQLSGTPFAIGRQHGRCLGVAIRALERAFLDFLTQFYGGGLRGRLRARSAHLIMRVVAGAMMLRYWPPAFREELRGVVTGMRDAGCGRFDRTRLAVINSFDDIAGAWGVRSFACSAFAVRGEHGDMLVGRNLDYQVIPHQLAAFNTLFVYSPQNRQPFVSLSWPGYIGVVTGVNRQRLSLSLLTVPARDASWRGLPEGLISRMLLEEASTPKEAFERLAHLPRTVGNNLLLVSPHEGCVIESSHTRLIGRTSPEGVLIATNHYDSSEMEPLQVGCLRLPDSALDHRFLTKDGSQQRAREVGAQVRVGMNVADVRRLLGAPCLMSGGQIQSVVMDLGRGELWLAEGMTLPVCRSEYRRVTLSDVFA